VAQEYKNTNAALYEDIDQWERTEGIEFMRGMPLNGNESPKILDVGFGFGHYLTSAAYAYPQGTVYGMDGNESCIREVGDKVNLQNLTNVVLIGEHFEDFHHFEDESIDLVLLYDCLHASFAYKNIFLKEAHRVLKKGGCLSALPFHQSNWRDCNEKKKTYSTKKIKEEIESYGYEYAGSCEVKGIHWEKCHTLYYIQKGTITFDLLERMDVMNFIRK